VLLKSLLAKFTKKKEFIPEPPIEESPY